MTGHKGEKNLKGMAAQRAHNKSIQRNTYHGEMSAKKKGGGLASHAQDSQ